jgi:hypothetical protein
MMGYGLDRDWRTHPMMEQLDAEMLIGDPSSNPVSMSVRTALHSLKART